MWQKPIFTGGIPQLLSATSSLTSVFGMGTGVSSITSSPENFILWRFLSHYSLSFSILYPRTHIEKYIAHLASYNLPSQFLLVKPSTY